MKQKTGEKWRVLIWQLLVGLAFIIAQVWAVWNKKGEQALGAWLCERWNTDPWGVIGSLSLGLLGVLILIYAVLSFAVKSQRLLRMIFFFNCGVFALIYQVWFLVDHYGKGTLPWQTEGFWTVNGLHDTGMIVGALLACFASGILALLCFAFAFMRIDAAKEEHSYWRSALGGMHNTRMLVFAALMIAMARALSLVPGIPIFHTKMTFGFLARALCALVCGPVLGLVYGFVEDILGFILQPSGEFFFGYTLSTMLGVLIYAFCFYRRRITVLNLFVANLLVNLLVNAVLGSVWNVMTRGAAFWSWFGPSFIKNMATIVPKVIMLYFLFNSMLPILRRIGVLPNDRTDTKIRWF